LTQVAIIADKHLAAGFRLAGAEAFPIKSTDEARALLSNLVSEGKYDVVILTERLSRELHREKAKIVSLGKGRPVFAVIPDLQGPTGQRTRELHDLISESVGAELKFEV
jgi:V/A-type H+-transporting ATPase subunit F